MNALLSVRLLPVIEIITTNGSAYYFVLTMAGKISVMFQVKGENSIKVDTSVLKTRYKIIMTMMMMFVNTTTLFLSGLFTVQCVYIKVQFL